MTKASNNEQVGTALHYLNLGLAPLVEKELKVTYGGDWKSPIIRCLPSHSDRIGRDASLDDPQVTLTVVRDQWDRVFRRRLSASDRNLVFELRDVRNRWAHHEGFSTSDALRAMDSVVRLLASIDAKERDIVHELHNALVIELAQELLPPSANVVVETDSEPPSLSEDNAGTPVTAALQRLVEGVDVAMRRTHQATVDKAYNLARQVEAEGQATIREFRETLEQQVRAGAQLTKHLAALTDSTLRTEAASNDACRDLKDLRLKITEQSEQSTQQLSLRDDRLDDIGRTLNELKVAAMVMDRRVANVEEQLEYASAEQQALQSRLRVHQQIVESTDQRVDLLAARFQADQAATQSNQTDIRHSLESLSADYEQRLLRVGQDQSHLVEKFDQCQARLETLSHLHAELQGELRAKTGELYDLLQSIESHSWQARFRWLRHVCQGRLGALVSWIQNRGISCANPAGEPL